MHGSILNVSASSNLSFDEAISGVFVLPHEIATTTLWSRNDDTYQLRIFFFFIIFDLAFVVDLLLEASLIKGLGTIGLILKC
ncbi:hypothetical protein RAT170B_0496 [Rickettsia argasii T170-B]|uniref:Uncharacterized protein n=1 Tax=Rickettsia argasii T170-B TaxID=1268837 RepID=A0A0F3RHR9_9RICK|nr:hypothetical protein RAT170B_0496 [Rickettsia argasii T170-B]